MFYGQLYKRLYSILLFRTDSTSEYRRTTAHKTAAESTNANESSSIHAWPNRCKSRTSSSGASAPTTSASRARVGEPVYAKTGRVCRPAVKEEGSAPAADSVG